MKLILWIAGALLSIFVFAAVWLLNESPGRAFERLVYPDRSVAQSLRFGQASCMHCPRYFRFDASPDVIHQIIVQRELESVAVMPEFMEQTIVLFDEDWWIDLATLARAKKYWVFYEHVDGESRMRLALVDGSTIYFASTGFPEVERYRKIPLKEQTLGTGTYLQLHRTIRDRP